MTAINNKLQLFVESVRTDQVGSMEHLWLSITRLGSALDAVLSRVQGVENEIGDTSDLMDNFNLTDLSEGLTRALNQASTGESTQLVEFQERIVDLQEKVGDLEKLISAVDDNHQKAGRFLLEKLRGFTPVRGGMAHGATALSLTTPIINDEGVEIGTLALILQGFENLSRENALLCERVEGHLVALASHGGVVLDGLVFSSGLRSRRWS